MTPATEAARRRYFWDFFGPNSEGTARHFREHLREFFDRHAVIGYELEVSSAGPGHHAASCTAPEEAEALILSALRPRRHEPLVPG